MQMCSHHPPPPLLSPPLWARLGDRCALEADVRSRLEARGHTAEVAWVAVGWVGLMRSSTKFHQLYLQVLANFLGIKLLV